LIWRGILLGTQGLGCERSGSIWYKFRVLELVVDGLGGVGVKCKRPP